MEHKLFDIPHSHDKAFYKDREVANHIKQEEHRPRLIKVLEYVTDLLNAYPEYSVSDFGCGNGGLLELIPTENKWGYDLQPSNVADAKTFERPVYERDFINEYVEYGDIVICTEVLEHLPNPHAFLKKLKDEGVKYVIASTPGYETPDFHADFHLWVWTDDSFSKLFTDAGWHVEEHLQGHFQFVIAS